jgi:hypothetical protein
MIPEKLLDSVFNSLLELDGIVDVPLVPMDKSITTNIEAPPTRNDRPVGIMLIKKKEDEEDEEDPGKLVEKLFLEQGFETPPDPGNAQGGQVGGAPPPEAEVGGAGQMQGGVPSMYGMGTVEPQLSTPGRGLELKKIFSRLLSLSNFLSSVPDQRLVILRDYVNKGIELFRTVIDNLAWYKDKIDGIIVLFYEFIEKVYTVIRQYYVTKIERSKDQYE